MASLARPLRIIVVLAVIAVVACGASRRPARGSTISLDFFVAPGGDDGGAGTVSAPWGHFAHAVRQAAAG